jgi:hypothetical protein
MATGAMRCALLITSSTNHASNCSACLLSLAVFRMCTLHYSSKGGMWYCDEYLPTKKTLIATNSIITHNTGFLYRVALFTFFYFFYLWVSISKMRSWSVLHNPFLLNKGCHGRAANPPTHAYNIDKFRHGKPPSIKKHSRYGLLNPFT